MNAPAHPSQERAVPRGALDDVDADAGEYNAQLPPFGSIGEDASTHGQACAYLTRIGEESKQDLDDGGHLVQAEENAKYYQWGQAEPPDPERVVANDIQPAVVSITDMQTRDAYSIFIRPVQTRDVPQVYWLGPPVDARVAMLFPGLPPGLGMEPVIDPLTGGAMMEEMPADPMTGQQPADPLTGGAALQPVMQPQQRRDTPLDPVTAFLLRRMLAQGLFPAEWLYVLDDKAVADVYQTVFDIFWKQDKLDDFLYEHQLKANVFGWQTGTYGWDEQRQRHIVRDISIKQARLDPNAEGSSFELQNDPGYEVVYDLDEAKALWPQLADLIEEYAREGSPQRTDSYSEFGAASDRHFKRRTVTFLVHWFRNQPMPMTEQEAVAAGHVTEQDGVYYSTQAQETGNGEVPDVQQGGDSGSAQQGGAGVSVPSDQAGSALDGGNGAEDTQGIPAATEGSPGELPTPVRPVPSWPMTTGIRQVATIAQTQRIVQDIRCEHWDVPMFLTPCIPLPSRPYGQGLPEKLRGLQQADTRLLNSSVKYAEAFAIPGCLIAQSVASALPGGLKRMHIDPTETLVCPDHILEKGGDKAIVWFQPPPLPEAVVGVMEMIDARVKQVSGHPEVMQGVAPSPTSSGKMVQALQAGAAGQFGYLAKATLRTVERIANLMHYTHLWRLPLADMVSLYGRLPEELMALVVERAQKGRWDNQVDANGSAGGQRNKKLQEAMALFGARSGTGEPAMPLRLLRDAAGIDDEEASLAYRNELQTAAPAMQPGQEQGGEEQGGGGEATESTPEAQ